jgi:hypothetical protein
VNVVLNNPPKALIILVALICITALMVTNSIDETAGAGLIGSIVGYAVGNGIAAKNGETVEPIVKQRSTE